MAGESYPIENDSKLLTINSPQKFVGGPYTVVYKNIGERWAIVTMDWDKRPGLGIRWFWGNSGNPFSSGHPTWLFIPSSLLKTTLDGLPLQYQYRADIEKYLMSEFSGKELASKYNN